MTATVNPQNVSPRKTARELIAILVFRERRTGL